jgi:hypothetical protein
LFGAGPAAPIAFDVTARYLPRMLTGEAEKLQPV